MPKPLLVAFAFLIACSDGPTATSGDTDEGGGPGPGEYDPSGIVEAQAIVVETSVGPNPSEAPWIQCGFTLSASYVGQAGSEATITALVLRFHAGPDRTEPIDSTIIPATDVRQAFGGGAQLESGDTLYSGWYFRSSVPYNVTGYLRWSEDGDPAAEDAPFAFTCGPELNGEAPPTLTNVRITPSTDSIEAGTNMQVEFEIASELGLWETWLIVSSPPGIDTIVVAEQLRANATRSITVRHPFGSAQGTRLEIQVVTFDAWLRPAGSPMLTSPAVYDTQPPSVSHYYLNVDHQVCNPRGCQFASDTLLGFAWGAFDNGGLGYARLEIGDPPVWRDSAALSYLGGERRFPTSLDGLDGIYAVRGSIADAADNRVDVDMGELNVYPANGPEHTTELLLQTTHRALPDFATGRLYMVPSTGPVLVYDIATLTQIGEIAGPGASGPADLTQDGRLAIVHAGSDTIGIGHGSGSIVTAVVDRAGLEAELYITGIAVTATGTIIVVMQGNQGRSTVLELDPIDGTQRTLLSTPAGANYDATSIARSGDGSRVVVALLSGCAHTYDVASQTLGACVTIRGNLAGDATGNRWATSRALYDGSLTQIGLLDRDEGYPVLPAAPGWSYVATRRGLTRFDEATGLIRESHRAQEYTPDQFSPARLYVSPDSAFAVIAGRPQSGVNTYQTLITVVRLN